MRTYYISGPMRGLPDHNYPAFLAAEERLAAWLESSAGLFESDESWEIINPARNFGGDKTKDQTEYLRVDIAHVARADAVVLLPGWEKSEGAGLEVEIAKAVGAQFIRAYEGAYNERPVWLFVPLDTVPSPKLSPRADLLRESEALITGDRNNSYGPPTQDFQRSSDAMTAFGYRRPGRPGDPGCCPHCGAAPMRSFDTAILVDIIKTSRLMWSPYKRDNWADKAGYTGCGYECAMEEQAKENEATKPAAATS